MDTRHMAATKAKNKGGTGTGRRGGGNTSGLRPFPKGQSGNPGGRAKGVREVIELAREESEASIRRLAEIRDNPKTPPMAAVAACNSLLDRAYGRPSISAALAVADLTGEATGGAHGLSVLLGRVIDYKKKHELPPPPALAAQTISAPPPDFVAAPNGEVREPDPPAREEPTEPPAAPSARPPLKPMKPTPEEWLSKPAPAKAAAPQTAAPSPPKEKPKYSGMPAEFAAEQERLEKLRDRLPGRQATREDFYRPDPVATSVQGAPEHVAFTLAGHGRIKRIAG
jgi:hypothetical protein